MRGPGTTQLLADIMLKRDKVIGLVEGNTCCGPIGDDGQHRIAQVSRLAATAIEVAENPDSSYVDAALEDVDECARLLLVDFEALQANGAKP